MSKRRRRERGLTHAQKLLACITLVKMEAAAIRKSNTALAMNKVRRGIEAGLKQYHARFITHNQSNGRGAHYRMPDGSAIGAEVIRELSR